jgi:hypothetical protein
MHRLRAAVSYSNVTATLALVIALGGGVAYAATISGKDIKNHSIGAIDIKDDSIHAGQLAGGSVGSAEVIDGSLHLRDLNAEVRRAMRKSVVQQHTRPGTEVPQTPAEAQAASLSLPNGNYLLTATVQLTGALTFDANQANPSTEMTCWMGDPGQQGGSNQAMHRVSGTEDFRGEYHDNHVMPLVFATPVTSGSVVIKCSYLGSSAVNPPSIDEVTLEAMPLDAIG